MDPGNTPDNKDDRSGISSAISLGTKVSQSDLIRILVSHSTVISDTSFNLAFSALFKLPAETRTDLSALSPKS